MILDEPFVVNGVQLSELEWLDRGVRKVFGLSLARLHANFLATHGGYVPARLTKAPSGTPAEARTAWLERNFGPCPVTTLTATQPGGETEMSIADNAARCIRARVFGSGKADLTINVRSESMQALEALRIGTVGGEKVGTPLRIESPVGGGYIGVWEFAVDAGERESFVITNMADDPTLTLPFRGAATVMTNFWESSLTDAGQPAERRRGDAQAAPGGDATRQRARDELDADLAGLSNRSTAGASVTFERNRPKCSEPFGATGCGPLTGINLSLTPGVLGNFYKTSGTGGPTAQVMTTLIAIADRGALDTDQDLKASIEEMEATEGGWVKIELPAIDYGFKGEISNAAITVNGGSGQGDLEARGPEDSQPGRGLPGLLGNTR